ncbi:CD4-1 molecule isoform X2 [Stegastes partitus]|uniref:MAM domain-containing glycosylphosphatidylinositol anchor protein 2-like n=1 Tax=Stegastes partitus TaxID=144197 RepID=A0A3B5BCM8_9TELE|nr:PREDICTED: MAM domain-containing glycosylphosphatidylinositol anchor protein 2-like isoform X2 [Stegastes partitus]
MKSLIQSTFILIAVLASTMGAEDVIRFAQVGETVKLVPQPPNPQRHYVIWHFHDLNSPYLGSANSFGGKTISENESWKKWLSMEGYSLVISNIQEAHFGKFIFKMTSSDLQSPFFQTFRIIKVDVTMKPPSLLLPEDSLSLTCTVGVQMPNKPSIQWLNAQGQKVTTRNGLHTSRVTGQDNGQWTCVVTSNNKEQKIPVSVKVADFSPAPSHKYTSTSSSLSIPCSILSNIWEQLKTKDIEEVKWDFFPQAFSGPVSRDGQKLFSLSLEDPLTWKKDQNRGLSPAPDVKNGNLSLTRIRGKENDRGSYECSIKFKGGKILKRTVHVDVLQIIASPGTEMILGQMVNLSCTTGSPLPSDVQLKWFPPEKPSVSIPDHHSARLTIPEVGSGHSGKWRCELWQSNIRLTSAVVKLSIVEPKMNVWMVVIICSTAVIIILLVVVAVSIRRRRQRRMRHLRHQVCQCKNPKPKGFYRT